MIILLEDAAARGHNPPVPHEALDLIDDVIQQFSPSEHNVYRYYVGETYNNLQGVAFPKDFKEPEDLDVNRDPILWIKWFRGQTGGGLKWSKDICDIRRQRPQEPLLEFLDTVLTRIDDRDMLGDQQWVVSNICNAHIIFPELAANNPFLRENIFG
jgi:hypothetical protein